MKRITLRKVTSLVALWSFFFITWTGITLYFVPPGRISYWVVWKFLGLTKTQYSEIHETFSILFLISMGFHIWLNWKAIVMYLKNKSKKLVIFTKEMLFATIISFIFLFGTLYYIPPFSSFLNMLEMVDDNYEKIYGEPPFGHAELLSLENFCNKMKLDLDKSIEKLRSSGFIKIDTKASLKELAILNHTTPAKIYELIKNFKIENKNNLNDEEKLEISGLGRMKVERLAEKAGVSLDIAIERLKSKGIYAKKDSRVKDLAESKAMIPMDLYYIVRGEK